MKTIINLVFSIFFAIAIGVHIYYVIEPDGKPFWWHSIYYFTYGTCWRMLFSKHKMKLWLYSAAAIFPFTTHVYYGYRHFPYMDATFWVCLLVCVMLLLGISWLYYSNQPQKK